MSFRGSLSNEIDVLNTCDHQSQEAHNFQVGTKERVKTNMADDQKKKKSKKVERELEKMTLDEVRYL